MEEKKEEDTATLGGAESFKISPRLYPYYRYAHLGLFLIWTLLAVLDRFYWNVWPRQSFPGVCNGGCGNDFIGDCGDKDGFCLKPGPGGAKAFDAIARASARIVITSTNLMFFTMCHGTWNALASTKLLRPWLYNIREDNLWLHKVAGIFMGFWTVLHVWSLFLPSLLDGYTNFVYGGPFEWPANVPLGRSQVDVVNKAANWGVDDIWRIVWMTLIFCVFIPVSRSLWALRKNYTLAMWLHILAGIGFFIDSARRRTHPHVWVLNLPLVLWYLVDKLVTRFWYRVNNNCEVTRIRLGEDYMLLLWAEHRSKKRVSDIFWLKTHDSRNCNAHMFEFSHPFTCGSVHHNTLTDGHVVEVPTTYDPHWEGQRYQLVTIDEQTGMEELPPDLVESARSNGGPATMSTLCTPVSGGADLGELVGCETDGEGGMTSFFGEKSDIRAFLNTPREGRVRSGSFRYSKKLQKVSNLEGTGLKLPDLECTSPKMPPYSSKVGSKGQAFTVSGMPHLQPAATATTHDGSSGSDVKASKSTAPGNNDRLPNRELHKSTIEPLLPRGKEAQQGNNGRSSSHRALQKSTSERLRRQSTADYTQARMGPGGKTALQAQKEENDWTTFAIIKIYQKEDDEKTCMGALNARKPETQRIAELEGDSVAKDIENILTGVDRRVKLNLRVMGPYHTSPYGRLEELPNLPPLMIIATGAGAGLILDTVGLIRARNITLRNKVTMLFSCNSLPLLQFVANTVLAQMTPNLVVRMALSQNEELTFEEATHDMTSKELMFGRLSMQECMKEVEPGTEVYFCGSGALNRLIGGLCGKMSLPFVGSAVQ
ncbi:unnamed protein product [Chrysoparadoxa australica]